MQPFLGLEIPGRREFILLRVKICGFWRSSAKTPKRPVLRKEVIADLLEKGMDTRAPEVLPEGVLPSLDPQRIAQDRAGQTILAR